MNNNFFCTTYDIPKWSYLGLQAMYWDVFYTNPNQKHLTRSMVPSELSEHLEINLKSTWTKWPVKLYTTDLCLFEEDNQWLREENNQWFLKQDDRWLFHEDYLRKLKQDVQWLLKQDDLWFLEHDCIRRNFYHNSSSSSPLDMLTRLVVR